MNYVEILEIKNKDEIEVKINYQDGGVGYKTFDEQDIKDLVEILQNELDKYKEEKKQLIEWLESKNKKYLPDYLPATIKIDEVLDHLRRIKNGEL